MHPRAEEFAECARAEHGFEVDVHEFPEGTKTAANAAEAVGCDVAQIASGIVMNAEGLVLVVTSGANRVDEGKLGVLRGVQGDEVEMADAAEIKETLGWAIGGVPPFCHETDAPVFVDEMLTQFDTVWAAAGTPKAVFPIAPPRLLELTGAETADVAR